MKGAVSGRNHGSHGYVNNTRAVDTPEHASEDPNRHCTRPTFKGKMKCSMCFDYNKGVKRGKCLGCLFERFNVSDDHDLALAYEKAIEQNHRWSEEEQRANGANTHLVRQIVQEILGKTAVLTKEGSVRKNTSIRDSDVDLMVTLSHNEPVTEEQRVMLKDAISLRTDEFKTVYIAKHAIKVVPVQGAAMDIVAHISTFSFFQYLKPAEREILWKNAAPALAVSGLKVWWAWECRKASKATGGNSFCKVTGFGWEELVAKAGR